MASIPQVAEVLNNVFSRYAEEAARSTGFVHRARKFSGATFAQTLVFGWLRSADSSLSSLTQMAAAVGVGISNQGLDRRFTEAAAKFMKEILQGAAAQVIVSDPVSIPLLQRFNGVFVQDSSAIILPNELSEVWRGNGSRTGDGESSLKIQVRLDLSTGGLVGPLLEAGRCHDNRSSMQNMPLPAGALRIADLGYFSLDRLEAMEENGVFYLSRLKVQTSVFSEEGNRLDLLQLLEEAGPEEVDLPILLGGSHRLRTRLLAVRVPPEVANERRRRMRRAAKVRGQTISKRALRLAEWTILVTNAPKEKLSMDEALIMLRARWQIELLFKLWKQHGQIDESRSTNPWRILCEVYAKLTAVVIQHWLSLVGAWKYPDRSLVKAAQTVRAFAITLASAMADTVALAVVIGQIAKCLALGCRMNSRKNKPNTYQRLLGVSHAA
ncbi:MAG: IS4 family transposase [Chloroflexi bacterium]|nr:IS4 family transposase [Chloroflexota bacterium]